ncbi:MAG: DUF4405 domain-containing protein [Chloroflexota bacterium]
MTIDMPGESVTNVRGKMPRRQPRNDSATARYWGVRPRLILDIVLLISFVTLMSVRFTGLAVHEWWGISLVAAIVIHLLLQWDWTAGSTQRLFRRMAMRVRLTYLLNWALFIAVVLLIASGILISEVAIPRLGLPTARGDALFNFWRRTHSIAADACIVLSGLHLGLNWRWVWSAMRLSIGFAPRSRKSAAAGGRS